MSTGGRSAPGQERLILFVNYSAMLATIGFGIWLRRRPKAVEGLSLSDYKAPQKSREYFRERADVVAALLIRWAAENQPDRAAAIADRSTSVTLIRERGLWDRLESEERTLLSSDTGTWTQEQKGRWIDWSEQLRLLRWLLRLNEDVAPLSDFPPPAVSLSVNVPAPEPTALRQRAEVGRILQSAEIYSARTLAEFRSRGLGLEGQLDPVMSDLRHEFVGDSTDLLAGARTIADLDDEELVFLMRTAVARYRYAAYLRDQVEANEVSAFHEWETATNISDDSRHA